MATDELLMTLQPVLGAISGLAQHADILIPVIFGVAAAFQAYAVLSGIMEAKSWLAGGAFNNLFAVLKSNPILMIATAIGVVIALIYAWIQSVGGIQVAWMMVKNVLLSVWGVIKIAFFTGVFWVLNLIDKMVLKWLSMAVNLQNTAGDMKANILMILQGMVNGAIDIINKPYRTIQKAVDAIKPYHTDASIIIGAGDYDESVEIRNKTASIGLSRETRENKVKLKYIGAAYCRQIWLDGLSFDGTGLEGDRPCINVMCVNNMQIHYCEIAGGPAIGGIGLDSASAYVANTSISNCGRAITVIYNSLLTARGVGGAGNQIGYSAHSSILNITGSSLQATTLTEKRNGGIIYKDGVLV